MTLELGAATSRRNYSRWISISRSSSISARRFAPRALSPVRVFVVHLVDHHLRHVDVRHVNIPVVVQVGTEGGVAAAGDEDLKLLVDLQEGLKMCLELRGRREKRGEGRWRAELAPKIRPHGEWEGGRRGGRRGRRK